ncbi:hypothetical protein NE237_030833 [Protea cynaroides]|uniref:Uncharacterized protein n=1 Tax=Protea cynaroides TaxID=273540 RepID=A0A9Q0JW61_9MAGN|nr:hypothetical protein NE237_030833 [Protea cynaroides]
MNSLLGGLLRLRLRLRLQDLCLNKNGCLKWKQVVQQPVVETDNEDDSVSSTGIDREQEFNFMESSGSSGGKIEMNPSLSPSDDLFFKGLEPSSLIFNSYEPNSKPQFPVSLLKFATKFHVLMLRV